MATNESIASRSAIAILYLGGKHITIPALPTESYVYLEKRRGWVEKQIRSSNDFSLENIVACIKLSVFWYNYVHHGSKYPNVVTISQYSEWDNDLPKKIKPPIEYNRERKKRYNNNRGGDRYVKKYKK